MEYDADSDIEKVGRHFDIDYVKYTYESMIV